MLLDQGIVRIHPESVAVVLRGGRIADGTRLAEVGEADGEARDVAAADDVHGLVVDRGVVDGGLLQPVGAVPGTGLNLGVLLGDEGGPVVLGRALDVIRLVVDLHVLLGIQRGDPVGVRVLPAVIGVEGDLDLAGPALLGRHEDDAVGGPGAVNGAGSRVLQDVDGLDVVRGEGGDVAARDAVDDIQRRAGARRAHPSDRYLVAFARLTGILDDVHASRLALQGAEGIDRIHGGQFLAGDVDGGTGDEFLALGTVTHHDDLVQDLRVLPEDDAQALSLDGCHGDGFIADAGDFQARAPMDGQDEGAVTPGQGTVAAGPDFHDAGPDDRLSGCVQDDTAHLYDGSRLGSRLFRRGREGRRRTRRRKRCRDCNGPDEWMVSHK